MLEGFLLPRVEVATGLVILKGFSDPKILGKEGLFWKSNWENRRALIRILGNAVDGPSGTRW